MFQWLTRLFQSRSAVQVGRDNPLLHAVVQLASQVDVDLGLRDQLPGERRRQLARELYLELHEICNAAEPAAACRQKLAAAMLRLARFQVLVIPPPPEDDATGLRGMPGITGSLKAELPRIAQADSELRGELYELGEPRDFETLWEFVRQAYWQARWSLEAFEAALSRVDDRTTVNDWHRSYLYAVCASQEHVYRCETGMPPALPPATAPAIANAYSLFTDIVVSGAADPVGEWRDYHAGTGICLPEPALAEVATRLTGSDVAA